jgi:hypothetical protein
MKLQLLPRRTYGVSAKMSKLLMLFGEVMAVYCDNKRNINTVL